MTTLDQTAPVPVAADQSAPVADAPAAPDVSLVTKMVLIEGDRFSVPYDTAVEQIRETLRATFPGISTARVQTGTTTIAGVTYETVEFTKHAGTKGLHPLAALADLPRLPPVFAFHPDAMRDMRLGRVTFAEALAWEPELADAPASTSGVILCQRLDRLSAAPADASLDVPGWSR